MAEKGLIHIYTGDGKGKTTAAVGLSVRASGRGRKVVWTSFLKDYDSGEFMLDLPFEVFKGQAVTKFWFVMDDSEKAAVKAEHTQRLKSLFARAKTESIDLLILDETLGALAVGALDESDLIDCLKSRHDKLEVVLTGRDPSPALMEIADYVSEMKPLKHPYEAGVPAREAIEF